MQHRRTSRPGIRRPRRTPRSPRVSPAPTPSRARYHSSGCQIASTPTRINPATPNHEIWASPTITGTNHAGFAAASGIAASSTAPSISSPIHPLGPGRSSSHLGTIEPQTRPIGISRIRKTNNANRAEPRRAVLELEIPGSRETDRAVEPFYDRGRGRRRIHESSGDRDPASGSLRPRCPARNRRSSCRAGFAARSPDAPPASSREPGSHRPGRARQK